MSEANETQITVEKITSCTIGLTGFQKLAEELATTAAASPLITI